MPFPTPSWELESCSETSSSVNPRHRSRRVTEEPITPGRRPGKEVVTRSLHKDNREFGIGESNSKRSGVRPNRRIELNYQPVSNTDPTYHPEEERTSGLRISVHSRLGRTGAVFDARRRVEQIRGERDSRLISHGQTQGSEGRVRQPEGDLSPNANRIVAPTAPIIPTIQTTMRTPGAMQMPPHPLGDRLANIQMQLDAVRSQQEMTSPVTFSSPFSQEIRDAPLPPSFKLPTAKFDGSGDPRNHVDTISEMMELHQVSDLAKCRCLAASLTQEARDWYRKIPAGSIVSWEQFANMFFQRYQAGRRFSMPVSFLSNIRQERDESVSDYLARFQQERSKVIGASEEAVKNFLIAGVRQQSDLWKDIQAEEESITLARFYQIASKYQRVERSIALLRSRPSAPTPPVRPREDWRDRDQSRFSKKARLASKEVMRPPTRNPNTFTPLVASLSEIYATSEHVKKMPRPPGLFTPRNTRNPRKFCEFHRDIGHTTNDCVHLRELVEKLVKQGHLQEYVKTHRDQPKKEDRDDEEGDTLRRHSQPDRVGMIFGGPSVAGTSRTARNKYAREARSEPPTKAAKILAVGVTGKRSKPEAEIIGFSEDEECPGNPGDGDALVIDTNIANTEVCRILIDNGSAVNILFLSTLHAMGFDSSDLRPMPTPLHGFNSKPTIPVGAVKLPVTLGQEEHKRKLIVEFLVVDCQFAYNAVFGRPLLMAIRAATSIVCQSMKFRTPTGVGIVHSSSKNSRECYKNAISMAENSAAVSALPIETLPITSGPAEDNIDPRNPIEEPATGPVEQLREVIIDDNEPTKTVKIGASLDEEIANNLVTFLRSNTDVFAFKHADMVGIDPEVICHRLNADKDCRPIRQKRRTLDGERSLALKEEVDRLIEIKFIREVDYPQWIANPVLVKKPNGKWRTCIDFTNLNKACPKDSFPLPRIDQLVDATAGHALLSFMDAYSGYNQIPMYPPDEEHTSFITDRGLYCYKVMPFGLRNAGATYQRLVNKIFAELIGNSMEVYVDDMLVKSRQAVDHVAALNDTFKILRKYKMKLNPLKCAFGVGSGKFLGFMVNERGIEANPEKIQALLDMRSPEKSKQVQCLTGRVAALNRFVSRATDRCLPFFEVLKGNKKFQWNEECEQAFQDLKQYLGQPPLLSKPEDGETLTLYLAVSPHAISAALMREEGGIQRPIYFVSKRLIDAETRYPEMEKLALALLIASRKLRPYFLAHSINVLTNYPLRKIMQKPETSGRMMQWAIELSQFDIAYIPRTSNKGQALADFVSEFSYWPKEISPQDTPEAMCQIESTSDQIAHMSTWTAYVDGSSNETSSGAGVYLKTPEGKEILGAIKFEFRASNNEAEYEAILAGISLLNEMGAQRANIFSDSKLAVSHIAGTYQVKGARLALYLEQTKAKLANFKHYTVQSISRGDNLVADALAKLASSLSKNSVDIALIKYLRTPSIVISETESLSVEERASWMDPIVGYLKEGIVPQDKSEARSLRTKSARYVLINEKLYKRGYGTPLLRCVNAEDGHYVLKEIHEGICGNHAGGRSLAHKVLRQGFYWPTIYEDAIKFVKHCEKCQHFASMVNAPSHELVMLSSPWPFAMWGIDLIGPLPEGKGRVKFAVVAVDYFTKWVEAKPLATITTNQMKDFVYQHIICRFGIPHTIITDNGKQFDNDEFVSFCTELGIRKNFSSVYRPQANGQVEAVNKVIKHTLKRKLDSLKGRWADDLPEVLWSYRTTPRTPTGETPFSLSYGCEAMAPVEVGISTFRREVFEESLNEDLLKLRLDLIDEHRKNAQLRVSSYQQKVKAFFDGKVKTKSFQVGDLVLRKVMQGAKDPKEGSLSANWEGPYKIASRSMSGAYHLQHLNGKGVPRSWNADLLRKYYQ